MRRPDPARSGKYPVRPTTPWKSPFKTRSYGHDRGFNKRDALIPLGFMGFMAVLAVILIFGIIVSGPDTHANLWNEVRDGYTRTEVIYISPVDSSAPGPGPEPIPGESSFLRDVMPVFQSKCAACHGLGVAIAGVSLTSYDEMMASEASSPLVVPGKPEESLLLTKLRDEASPMPPSGLLPQERILAIEEWIAQGAQND